MSHILLAGSDGMGTTAVGQALAEALHLPFIDGEARLLAAAATPLPHSTPEAGQDAGHALEARVLTSLLKEESAVVALGGTLTSPESLALAKRTGTIVCLSADLTLIDQQVTAQSGQRPLLKVAEPLAKIRELLDTRQPSYAQTDARVNTTGVEPEETVGQVLDWLNRVQVNLGERSYDIHIQEGCHAWIGPLLARLPDPVSTVVVISNRDIDRSYGDAVRTSLDGAALPHHTLLVPAGEQYKSMETATRLYGDFIQRKIDRKAVVVALGGGVLGDLTGFVAATYQRGTRFVQIPTSLLSQVDSSVGGKVGVNHHLGKNMIGAFLQPNMVLIDPNTLATLPIRELRSGIAEIIKYGVIWDEDFFTFLEGHVEGILRLEPQCIKHLIRRSCQIKAHVVGEDERESGLRAILNYGHTAAHAVETYTSYERYTHGEAVAVGMVIAGRIAHFMGMLRAEPVHRLIRLLERFGLPTHLPKTDPGVLMSLMDTDKKAVAGTVHFVLPTKIGRVDIANTVPRDFLRRAIKESIEL